MSAVTDEINNTGREYHDLRIARPVQPGKYQIRVPFVGPMDVIYCDGAFYWPNRVQVPDNLCRWWK